MIKKILIFIIILRCNVGTLLAQDSIVVKPLFVPLNTVADEYYPFWSDNESCLYFTRRFDNIKELTLSSRFDFGKFYRPVAWPMFSEMTKFQGALTKNISNNAIYCAADIGKVYGLGNYDIFFSEDNSLDMRGFKNLGSNINTNYWESSPAINSKNNLLIFSSERPGGSGKKDLYYTIKNPQGEWYRAINMGKKINSSENDYAPYIYSDNIHVFFCSSRAGGKGGEDIYMFKIINDTTFTDPVLLDSPINTQFNDQSLVFKIDGRTAFLSSDRRYKNIDLFEVKFYGKSNIIEALSFLQFYVYNDLTRESIYPTITIQQDSLHINTIADYDAINGFYGASLVHHYRYKLHFELANYWSKDTVLYFDDNTEMFALDSFGMNPILADQKIIWNNILFANNSAEIDSSDFLALNELVKFLKTNDKLSVAILGYTDNQGSYEHNQVLSEKRAAAVVSYLENNGIAKQRLQSAGYGQEFPVADNASAEGRQLNRRIEIKIIQVNK